MMLGLRKGCTRMCLLYTFTRFVLEALLVRSPMRIFGGRLLFLFRFFKGPLDLVPYFFVGVVMSSFSTLLVACTSWSSCALVVCALLESFLYLFSTRGTHVFFPRCYHFLA